MTTPPLAYRVARSRDPLPLDHERHELLAARPRARGGHRVCPHEPRLLLAAPAQPSLDRVALLTEVVAIEVKADLHPQRVSRPEPGRPRAAFHQRVPYAGRMLGIEHQLHPVLARVARPADEHRHPRNHPLRTVHPRRQATVGKALDERPGLRPLDGQHRVALATVDHVDVEPVAVLVEPAQVPLVVGGVRDGQEVQLREAVCEEVVEHAAVLATEDAVLRSALGDQPDVVGEQSLEQFERLRTARLDLSHVRDVEYAGTAADCEMLLPDSLVLDRHLPAGERDQLRTGSDMPLVQRGAPEGALGGEGHRPRRIEGALT